jgi:hypothetical protein
MNDRDHDQPVLDFVVGHYLRETPCREQCRPRLADSMAAMQQDEPLETFAASSEVSKRAARRLIQRALVLVGRDRHIRQHLREARLLTLWVLEDWKFAWTVQLERGKIHFARRPTKHPDLTLTWPTAELFFRQIESGAPAQEGCTMVGSPDLRRSVEPLYRAFSNALSAVMRNPFDDEGNRLA